jgi:hypothetical protein
LLSVLLGLVINVSNIPSIYQLMRIGLANFIIISQAVAQDGAQRSAIPEPIVYAIYIVLLVLLVVSFYYAVVKKSQAMVVSYVWKTLLGFFIGRLTK